MRTILFALLTTGCLAASSDPDPASTDPGGGKADGASSFVVNGHTLNAREQQWMRYVAEEVLPDLPGDHARQLQIASRTAWWSLKEGIFDTSNAPKYSLCNSSSGDAPIAPLSICGTGRAWQVGLAAVQVPNHSLSELESLAQQLYPGETEDQVLADAAAEAGYAPGSSTSNEIVASTGSLRKSWLLRRSAIGFTACESNEVVPECIQGSLSWCYGTGWDTTRLYAPNKTAAMRAITDISQVLDSLSSGGTTPTPWVGSPCQSDGDCGFSSGSAAGFCFVPDGGTAGFCSLACEGYCPDEPGRSTTFCVAAAAGGGMCTIEAGPLNHQCTDLPGTEVFAMDRFLGASSAPAATADVCAYP